MSSSRPLRPRSPSRPPSGSVPPNRLSMRRINRVSQACGTCRQRKLKCDGRRPICHRCRVRNEQCAYANDVVGTTLRLETLETLIDSLRSRPPEQAADLLERIRTTDDIAALVAGIEATRVPELTEQRQGQYHERENSLDATSSKSSVDLKGSPVASVAPENENLQQSLSDLLVPRELPDELATQQAIDAFFKCSGLLFHVFSRAQIEDFVKFAFSDNSQDPDKRIIAMSCFSIVAAIGCQYAAGALHQEVEDAFYDNAKCGLDCIIEFSAFETIKFCSLLAMYNCMNKGTVALAYIEMGLRMAKINGLYEKKCPDGNLTPAEWADYRKAWRLLVFLSSWLSVTLGHLSENDALLKIPLSAININDSKDIDDIVQVEMTKISLLKVKILRFQLAFKEITISILESVMQDLEKWHGELPSAMKMANLVRGDISIGLRRSIYFVHLLHLGAIMLVYQRIAYEFHNSSSQILRHDVSGQEPDPLHRLASQGILAAKHSARILDLLMAEDGVFRRCWIVMLQAYTSCVFILHAVVQERLHGLPRVISDHDLELASKCLSVLEHCSKADQVALNFHEKLMTYYNKVSEFTSSGSDMVTGNEAGGASLGEAPGLMPEEPPMYLLQIPPSSDPEQRAVSLELLEMLCIPFRGPGSRADARADTKADAGMLVETTKWWANLPYFEDLQPSECEMEKETVLYDIGARSLIECAMASNAKLEKGWFLGGEGPYGWTAGGLPRTTGTGTN